MQYIGEGERCIALWQHTPVAPVARSAVVIICPPVGSEFVRAFRTLRRLAERLAQSGFTVYRPDYSGTGDSAGTPLDPGYPSIWIDNIKSVSAWLKTQHGDTPQYWFGMRFGATLAALAAQDSDVTGLLLWEPIIKGRAYVRELEALSKLSGSGDDATADYLESAGFLMARSTADAIRKINLAKDLKLAGGVQVLQLARDDRPRDESLVDSLRDAGNPAELEAVGGYADMMDEPHDSKVPWSVVEKAVDWLQVRTMTGLPVTLFDDCVGNGALHIVHDGVALTEQPLFFGADNTLFGVLAHPVNANPATGTCIVLANSGSVHHVGPNAVYSQISRQLAAQGFYVLRMDLENLGDSAVLDPVQENHPYQSNAVGNVRAAIEYLRSEFGLSAFVVGGLCSGAHTAFHCGLELTDLPVREIMMINPLTFYWHPGLSLDTPDDIQVFADQAYYKQSLRSVEKWKKLLSGKANMGYIIQFVWQRVKKLLEQSGKDGKALLLGEVTPLAQDFRRLRDQGLAVSFVLSSTDPGLDIIRSQAKWTLRKGVRERWMQLHVIDGADHTFSRKKPRDRLLGVLASHFGKCRAASPNA